MLKGEFKLLAKRARAFPCPSCGYWVARGPLIHKPFDCPGCGVRLQCANMLRGWSLVFMLSLAMLIAILIPFLAGARGLYLVIIAAIAFLPVLFLAAPEAGTLFGKLEICPDDPPKSPE